MRARPVLPSGNGELLVEPAFAQWADLARENHDAASAWEFPVGGVDARSVWHLAREEALDAASEFSARLGVAVRPAGHADGLVIATGHQPELYHPGVWVKDFLLQRLADETGATPVDLVVDSDGFESVSLVSPCLTPQPARCRQYLVSGGAGACYALTPVPDSVHVSQFCSAALQALDSLSSPAPARHFRTFCSHLEGALADATSVAELLTFARRRFEASAKTDYLELPVTHLARSEAYGRFLVHLALNAKRFATDHNAELADYRTFNRTRSVAQPFPDLRMEGDLIEIPFWRLAAGRRSAVFVRADSSGVATLATRDAAFLRLGQTPDDALTALGASGELLVPKALALTAFVRLFVADLFIHGVGAGRYETITDGVIRRFFGIEPPKFVVASLTVHLPLGAHTVDEGEISAARERLNRLDHNPDTALGEAQFDSVEEHDSALALSEEKKRLIEAISHPDADKKALSSRIRIVNTELARLITPLRQVMEDDLERLESTRALGEILTDRTYPFCFWNPADIADRIW